MNNQAKEKEKSLAELMVRILKEPLKPLDKSIADLNGDLSKIKEEIEEANNMLYQLSSDAESAAKKSNQAILSLRNLLEEQWLPSLQTYIADNVQSGVQTIDTLLAAHSDRSDSALTAVAEDMRLAIANISQGQRSTEQVIGRLPEHLANELSVTKKHMASMSQVLQEQIRQSQEMLDNSFALGESRLASGLKDRTVRIGKLVVKQQHAAQAMHQTMREEMNNATRQTQSKVAESLHLINALHESLENSHGELMAALNKNTEILNSRLNQSLTKIRYLAISTGAFFVLMLAYVGYDLLSKLN